MTPSSQTPNLQKVQERASQIQKICQRADAGILLLDDLIGQLEENARSSLLHQYHLKRAGHLLKTEVRSQ